MRGRFGRTRLKHITLTARVYPGVGHTISQEELDDVAGFLGARTSESVRLQEERTDELVGREIVVSVDVVNDQRRRSENPAIN